MMCPSRFLSFLLLLALPLLELKAGTYTKIAPVEKKEFFANGNVKSVTVIKISTPRNIDLFNFYKETKIIKTEFDSATGRKILHTVRVTKVGIGGRHCYEYSSKIIKYELNGDRSYFERSKCDKNYFMYKNYINGKVSFTHIEKRSRRRR